MKDMLKNSRQRDAIMVFLQTREDHPTAEMIYSAVQKEFPKISLGTVYRNLTLLTSLGKIRKIPCGNNADRYDAVVEPHYHFVCSECGCVKDLHMSTIDSMNELAQHFTEDEVIGHQVVFYGICKECKEK
jgi:Fur family peroxide stress response transcriptional regulator